MAKKNSGLRPWVSDRRPYRVVVAVAVSMKAVTSHDMWARPPRSPTMRGSAVLTMFWSRAASTIDSNAPARTTRGRATGTSEEEGDGCGTGSLIGAFRRGNRRFPASGNRDALNQ